MVNQAAHGLLVSSNFRDILSYFIQSMLSKIAIIWIFRKQLEPTMHQIVRIFKSFQSM